MADLSKNQGLRQGGTRVPKAQAFRRMSKSIDGARLFLDGAVGRSLQDTAEWEQTS
jgi:hypothetical protein